MANSYSAVEFNAVLSAIQDKFVGANSIFSAIADKFTAEVNNGGLDNMQKAQVLSQFFTNAYSSTLGEANKMAIAILESSINDDTKTKENAVLDAQKDTLVQQKLLLEKQSNTETSKNLQVQRETSYYNDQLKVKAAEFRANVAAFAVNADSTSAQSALDKLDSAIVALGA